LTDTEARVTDTYDYDAFGNLINQTGSTPNNYLYSGEQFDADLGLYYNRARYLDVRTGRFWGMDTWEGETGDPRSLHKYLYASDNPANRVDPSGNFSLAEISIVVGISLVLMTMSACNSKLKVITVGVEFPAAWDLGRDTLEQPVIDLVKQTALQTMRDAYKDYNVLFNEGGGARKIKVHNKVGQAVGVTWVTNGFSDLYLENFYNPLTNQLKCYPLSECVREGHYDWNTIAMALGRGIGATGAHELGHQVGLNFVQDIACDSCYDSDTAETRDHFFGPLNWSERAKRKMDIILPRRPN
jgi:RHS repeat-associated protein